MLNKKVLIALLIFSTGSLLSSCSEKEDSMPGVGNSKMEVYATSSQESTKGTNSRMASNGFSASEFTVSTTDLQFYYAAKADLKTGISLGNINLKTNLNSSLYTSGSQSKSIELIENGDEKFVLMAEGETPEGIYSQAEFKLKKNTSISNSDERYNKSFWLQGEVNGAMTIIWSETEKTIQSTSDSDNGIEVENKSEIVLEFDLEKLFSEVDLSLAIDGNSDGTIEIGPGGIDGNTLIYSKIMNNLDGSVIMKNRN